MSNLFKGRSIQDIMHMDIDEFSHLTKSELRQAVSRLADAANKRLKRLSKSDVVSPAYMEVLDNGNKFSTRGKSEIELQIEFRRVSNFLQDKTSTIKGSRAYMEETRKNLKDAFGIEINKSDFAELIKEYGRIINESPDYQSRALRYKSLKNFNIGLANNQMTTTELSDDVVSILNRYYQPGGSQYEGTANYFGFN